MRDTWIIKNFILIVVFVKNEYFIVYRYMNHLTLISDSSLELIAKFARTNHVFIILKYCSKSTAEQILYRNSFAGNNDYGFSIRLCHLKRNIIYALTSHNSHDCSDLTLFKDCKVLSLLLRVCGKCGKMKIYLWICFAMEFYETIVLIGCKCKK